MNQTYPEHSVTLPSRPTLPPRAAWADQLGLWQLAALGRGRKLWSTLLDLAEAEPGSRVLVAGCKTGALALRAQARVKSHGQVAGVDASPRLIALAEQRAQRLAAPTGFWAEPLERLPFPDAAFDAAISSLTLLRLPESARLPVLVELRRVLCPGGRFAALDFKRPESYLNRLLLPESVPNWMQSGVQDLADLLGEAGFSGVQMINTSSPVLGYVIACV